jgi:hypothetical protein
MNADVFAKDGSREDVRISFDGVVVRKTAAAILLAADGIRILKPSSGHRSDLGPAKAFEHCQRTVLPYASSAA